MIPREQGSDTSRVEIRGGQHDGATGTVLHSWDDGSNRVITVALDSGGTVELAFDGARRETASTESLRTLGT